MQTAILCFWSHTPRRSRRTRNVSLNSRTAQSCAIMHSQRRRALWSLEHFSVDWPKERARRQYVQYGEREATQGKSLKNALSQRLFNFWHRIGQGAQKKCWTVRRMEMNNAAVQRCKFEINQTVTASLRRRRGVHHRAAGLAWIQRVKHNCACLSLCMRRVRQHHAALEGAAIMHTRNHFLAWIAAFVEIHAADEFKIDILRHKLRLCGRRNPGFSRL